jgi:hypothetical protein
MARRKKSVRKSSRRRRIGAIGGGGDTVKLMIGTLGGAVAATFVGSKLPDSLDPKIKAAILLAAGFMIARQKSPIVRGLGLGFGTAGGAQLVNSLSGGAVGAIGWEGSPNSPQLTTIAGFQSYPNSPQMNVISGVEPVRAASAGMA